jgi:hypothetical protein
MQSLVGLILKCESYQRIACGYNVHCRNGLRIASGKELLLAIPLVVKASEPQASLLPREIRSMSITPIMTSLHPSPIARRVVQRDAVHPNRGVLSPPGEVGAGQQRHKLR